MGGGLLLGLPLLFTMEMWWHGFLIPPLKILLLVALGALVILGLNAVSGFRRDRSWREVAVDSVEAVGLGIVTSIAVLLLLGRLDVRTGLVDAAGKIALESIPIAIGASIATAQFGGGGADAGAQPSPPRSRGLSSEGRLLIAAAGALVFALNIAPTEEPVLLGIEAEWWQLLIVMAATYLVSLGLVFFAEFRGEHRIPHDAGPLATPLAETLAAYAVSLAVALVLLWAFGRTDGLGVSAIIGQTVMLGVVGAFGAAVGRILIQGTSGEPGEAGA